MAEITEISHEIAKAALSANTPTPRTILRRLAAECDGLPIPNWNRANCVHSWERYIPAALIDVWGQLSEETQLLAYVMASEQADSEDYE